jgi:hypothetical protein
MSAKLEFCVCCDAEDVLVALLNCATAVELKPMATPLLSAAAETMVKKWLGQSTIN